MMQKITTKERSQLLKRLREEHPDTVARTQERLKEHKVLRKQLCQHIRTDARTVPEISEASGIPANEVLWHITSMKKYDLVVETGMCGEYYLYQMAVEAKQ